MLIHSFTRSSHLSVSCEDAFQWHMRDGALERMMPPWLSGKIVSRTGSIRNGDTVTFKSSVGLVPIEFQAIHQNFIENKQFEDIQLKGPFAFYKHTHHFEKIDEKKSKIIDEIQYSLPMGFLSWLIGNSVIKEKLNRLFTYRHRTLKYDLFLHAKYSQKKLRILVTGSSGFVGSSLIPFLKSGGHEVIKLVRDNNIELKNDVALWDMENKKFNNTDLLEGLDAVIHLAGENIAAQKWNEERKKELIESRVNFTVQLCTALTQLKSPPKTIVAASGIGIFGSRDYDDILHEDSKLGEGFLAKLAQEWERASQIAIDSGIRVVHLRFGTIISLAGGVLKKMYTPYRLYLGGPFGSGRQMISWISIVDVLGLILFSISNHKITGAVNAVAPYAVSNEQFSELLAQTLDRPSSLRIPEIFVQTFFGEMGKELLLSGQHAKPIKATKNGYEFLHSQLHDVFSYYLGS